MFDLLNTGKGKINKGFHGEGWKCVKQVLACTPTVLEHTILALAGALDCLTLIIFATSNTNGCFRGNNSRAFLFWTNITKTIVLHAITALCIILDGITTRISSTRRRFTLHFYL